MKNQLFTAFFIIAASVALAQIESNEIGNLNNTNISSISASNLLSAKVNSVGTCQCLVPVDPTFSVVPMGAFTPPDYRNDDGSSASIPLGFNFCFYGTTYSSCFINNNGNITFNSALSNFSAESFPAGSASNLDTIMIAPFWGDVDTRAGGSGLVYYKKTATALIVKWNNVGYYNSMADKINDFQLIITDGTDPILPNGNNIAFCYGDMQWTTGAASMGTGGFGGTPATVGVNKGDNLNFAQIGLFDQAGLAYDGPYGANDGISFLDNKSYFFNTCGTNNNLPPIIQDSLGGVFACGDTIRICALGGALVYTTTFLSPENTQSITINGSAPSLGGSFQPLGVTTSSVGITTFAWMVVASPSVTGIHTIIVTGTDNGTPPLSSSATYFIKIENLPSISINGITNICKGSTSLLTALGAVSYTWNSGATTNSISITPTISTTYDVSGEDGNGCLNTSSLTVNIIPSKNISGIITSTIGAVTGDVILYKYALGLSLWDSVTTVPFTNSYTFSNIDSALYVVRALPTANNIQVTYGSSSASWQNATIISHGCSNNTNQNITLIDLATFTPGPGILSGAITEASGFGQRMTDENKPLVPGNPIGGIIVKGGKNPGGQMFVQTTTAIDGTYTLTGLPLNSATDGYFIFVDIPGLDTNGTYHVVLNSGNTQINNLNFTVDSVYINLIGSITSISNISNVLDNKIIVCPNPAKDYLSIQYKLIVNSTVNIELFDMLGKSVKMLLQATQQNTDIQKKSWQINDLSAGLYFIKISINGHESLIKLSVTK